MKFPPLHLEASGVYCLRPSVRVVPPLTYMGVHGRRNNSTTQQKHNNSVGVELPRIKYIYLVNLNCSLYQSVDWHVIFYCDLD